jgi:hypothetical protein
MKGNSACRLCLQEKKLVKKSHLIPDFMYQDLYDESHRFYSMVIDAWWKKILLKSRNHTGEYEGGILCVDCETKVLGLYESYASKAMYGGTFSRKEENPVCKKYHNSGGPDFTQVVNIDYAKFKLFLLSVLWRASISSREFFAEVDLGSDEETLRQMILSGNPGKVEDFPVLVVTYAQEKKLPFDVIANPQLRVDSNGNSFYIMLISAFIYSFYLPTVNGYPPSLKDCTIIPENRMNILHLPYQEALAIIGNLTGIGEKLSSAIK